jgi:hypothetical protein
MTNTTNTSKPAGGTRPATKTAADYAAELSGDWPRSENGRTYADAFDLIGTPDAQPLQAAKREILYADRSFSNESAGKEMAACLAENGNVECYFPTPASAERNGSLFLSAPALLAALENAANVLAALATGQLAKVERNSPALLQAREALQLARGAK